MRFRFAILVICCVVVAKCSAENSTREPVKKYNDDNREMWSSGKDSGGITTPNINEESSRAFGGGDNTRPAGGSSGFTNHGDNFSQDNRRPTNSGASGHNVGLESTNRPFGSGGEDFSQNSNSRPVNSGSSGFTNHEDNVSQGDRRPTNMDTSGHNKPSQSTSRPFGSGDENFSQGDKRPTNTHTTGHNKPSQSTNRPFGGGDEDFSQNTNKNPINSGSSGFSNNPQDNKRPTNTATSGHTSQATDRPFEGNKNTEKRPTHGNQNKDHTTSRPSQSSTEKNKTPQRETEKPAGTTPGDHYEPEYTQESNNNEHRNDTESPKPNEEEKEVCFRNVGCFSMLHPWKSILRPVSAPFSPEKILTTVFFFSRQNPDKQKNITIYPEVKMGEARFDPNKLTAMIVHGFANSGNASWMKDMKDAYLKKVDANVMLVDWGKGAQLWSYLQVAGNTRVVGKQLGIFVKYLIEHYGANPGKFHLIGHSLGAQICSYLAKDVPGIARLTALDPAQPGFEGFSKEVRLDKSDAEFVDVVHTDAKPFLPTLGFGMIAPHGHVDFYMNGGFDQPGCLPPPKKELPSIKNILDLAKYPVELISKMVACPHGRAYQYLTESFNETEKCIFWGHKADVTNVLKSVTNTVSQGLLKKFVALSTTCSKEDCIPLGFATKKSPLRGSFVITTGARKPFCLSEPGIPPETTPEPKKESFIQKIAKRTRTSG